MSNSFGKEYKLVSRKQIEEIHRSGVTVKVFPFVSKVLPSAEGETSLTFAISVPKRLHKKAVTRNLIKRRIREAIRINKHDLENFLNTNAKRLSIFVIYTSPEVFEYQMIEKKIKQLFSKASSL